MILIYRCIMSELLKLKRTLAFKLAIIIPAMMVLLQFFVALSRGATFMNQIENPTLWFGQQTIFMWSFLMLPLFVCLETTLICGMDHTGNNWKHLFVLPLSRSALYTAKQFSCLLVVAMGQAVLVLLLILAELFLAWISPELKISWPVPWLLFANQALQAFLGSLLIVALHTWVAMRWPSFVVSVGLGIVMTIVGLIIMNSGWSPYFPWTLPAEILRRVEEVELTGRMVWFSVSVAFGIYLFGLFEIRRREIY